jgi:hypothetical protein
LGSPASLAASPAYQAPGEVAVDQVGPDAAGVERQADDGGQVVEPAEGQVDAAEASARSCWPSQPAIGPA